MGDKCLKEREGGEYVEAPLSLPRTLENLSACVEFLNSLLGNLRYGAWKKLDISIDMLVSSSNVHFFHLDDVFLRHVIKSIFFSHRVTEEDIHRRMVEFEDNKPGKTKRARDKDGKGGEDSSEEEEEEETPSPSKRARDAGGDDLVQKMPIFIWEFPRKRINFFQLSSESSDDDILDDDLDLQEEEKEASPPPPPPPKQTTITTLSFAAADEDEALSTESEESDDEDR